MRELYTFFLFVLVAFPPSGYAAEHNGVLPDNEEGFFSGGETDAQLVEFPAVYFTLYQPNTALDMVRQVPGFQLDDGDSSRGFAASAGNILINGRRPSAKQDLPSSTLARIPASSVERIELIRGQTAGIDLQGQSVVANILLHDDIPASIRWELWVQQNNVAPTKPGGNISISDKLGSIDYNAGVNLERDTSGWEGIESVFDSAGVMTETGRDDSTEKGFRINSISLNAGSWLGQNLVHLNSKYTYNKTEYLRPGSSIPQTSIGSSRDIIILTNRESQAYEIGVDAERSLSRNLTGKVILLYADDMADTRSSRTVIDSIEGQTLLRQADTDTSQNELITRLEFDWLGLENHFFQFNLERAVNVLDRNLLQTDDRGEGPVVVEVPGANSRVKEVRWDFLLQDTWFLYDFEFGYGLGAEASTLSQTGDAEQGQDFFFIKPNAILTYSPQQNRQTRLRLAREVSQLNLGDFVSATHFEDNDIALGNPDIQPDTTWIAELSHERRLGSGTVVKATIFHHWISDVLDLLPITTGFEAPGNIGDGKRWGVSLESSLPLDLMGLYNAKLDLSALWQDSSVIDPVTGLNRRLSGGGGQGGYRTLEVRNQNIRYHLRADFRQDFEDARVAWGWTIAERGSRPLYKVNELDINNEGVAIDAFIETTRWLGIKIRLLGHNILDHTRARERTLYAGERGLTPVTSSIVSHRNNGRRITLMLDGSF